MYGYAGIAADVEVVELMLECLKRAEITEVHLDIGHMGLFLALAEAAHLHGELREAVFLAIQQKAVPTLHSLTAELPNNLAAALVTLPTLYGDATVLATARAVLPPLAAVQAALNQLDELTKTLAARGIEPNFDLSELRSGYYHTGLVFAAYAPGWANAIARGGRYDDVGQQFGRSRPATGFSVDLKELVWHMAPAPARPAILAPNILDAALAACIRQLRAADETVVVKLSEVVDVQELHANRELVNLDGVWQVRPLSLS
jgi:ATP phosphoribosyltransferase regulatory subunit